MDLGIGLKFNGYFKILGLGYIRITMKSRPKTAEPRASVSMDKSRRDIGMCELDKLPPVCESEHVSGYCYCHLCSCGCHLCPAEYKRKLISSQSQFITNYSRNYKRKSSAYFKHKPLPEFRPASYALNSQSTMQKDFRKQEFIKTETFFPLKPEYTPLTFKGKSSYSTDFGKWPESYLEKQYIMEFPCPLRQGKTTVSSYGNQFVDPTLKNYEENKDLVKKTKLRSRGTKGLISAYNEFIGKSSQKTDFKELQVEKPALVKGPGPILQTPDYRSKFITTYKESFSNPVFSQAIRKKFAKSVMT